MEEVLFEISSMRRLARLSLARGTTPDERTILDFPHLLKKQGLANQILATVNGLLLREGLVLKQGTIIAVTGFLILGPAET
jgi:IS5 family transposase